MAVQLESTIKRYIGLSSDDKPALDIPAGSSFMESDTGKIYRFTGESWRFAEPTDETAQLLTVIYLELQEIRALVAFATNS